MRYGLLILINVEKRIICADLRYRKLNTYYTVSYTHLTLPTNREV